MLTILAGVAMWEREIMLERLRDGIVKAKADGKYKGRPISTDAAQIKRRSVEMGPAAIAKRLGIAWSSVYRAWVGDVALQSCDKTCRVICTSTQFRQKSDLHWHILEATTEAPARLSQAQYIEGIQCQSISWSEHIVAIFNTENAADAATEFDAM